MKFGMVKKPFSRKYHCAICSGPRWLDMLLPNLVALLVTLTHDLRSVSKPTLALMRSCSGVGGNYRQTAFRSNQWRLR
jgi:hypothetical protein